MRKDDTGAWRSFGTIGVNSESAVDGGKDPSQIQWLRESLRSNEARLGQDLRYNSPVTTVLVIRTYELQVIWLHAKLLDAVRQLR